MAEGLRVLDRPVFTVADSTYTWRDVVESARLKGEWQRLEEETRTALACVTHLATHGAVLDEQEVDAAVARFRYAHRLLAGDDAVAWLDHWQLGLQDLRDHLRRELARRRCPDGVAATPTYHSRLQDVETAAWADAICSGFLERAARRLAADLAVALEAGAVLGDNRFTAFERAALAAERVLGEIACAEAVEREVALHAMDWLRVEGEALELRSEDLAREAALCIREDGRPLADVALTARCERRAFSVYIGDVDPDFAAKLASARPGEIVGPLQRDGFFEVLSVDAKCTPTAADPEVYAKAVELLVARATERVIAAHVTWHERV